MKKTLIAVAAVSLALAGIWWFWYRNIDHQLTEKPSRYGSSAAIPPTASSVQLSAIVPYTTVADAVTRLMPADISDQGRQNVCVDVNEAVQQTIQNVIKGGDILNFLGRAVGQITKIVTQVVTVNQLRHVCQDVDYRVAIHRDGPVSVSMAPAGSALRLTVPISVSGEAGFSGDIAKAVALDRKSFRGSILAFADVTADLGSDWCPKVQVTPDFIWRDKAQLEVAGKFWITIDGTAGPKIKDALGNAAQKIPESLNCNQFKAAIIPFWHPYSWPINENKRALAYLGLTPTTAGFSGLTFEPSGIRAAIALGASTEVTTTQNETQGKISSLPSLQRVAATSNKLSLAIPLRADYGDLQIALTRLMEAQEYSAITPAGPTHVRITKITVYPAGKSLVVGMEFAAHFERRVPNVAGSVYLEAQPILDQAAQTLRFKGISFTRDLDSKLWSILSAVFRGPIQASLEQKAFLDLKEPIKILRIGLKNELAAAAKKEGIVVALNDTFVGLRRINIGGQKLEILIGLEGTADVAVAQIIKANQ